MEEPSRPLRIYFAGDLFDSKDLGGNLLLADAIDRCSNGKYQVMLPQDGECEVNERTSQSIRDADFQLLFDCDVIAANFDGTDLDSGTVVEFCFAKMVDMPAVLLRTDFRDSGDHTLPNNGTLNVIGETTLQITDLQGAGVVNFTGATLSADSSFNSDSAEMVYVFDGDNTINAD